MLDRYVSEHYNIYWFEYWCHKSSCVCISRTVFYQCSALGVYMYEDGLFTVRLLSLRLTMTANYCQME